MKALLILVLLISVTAVLTAKYNYYPSTGANYGGRYQAQSRECSRDWQCAQTCPYKRAKAPGRCIAGQCWCRH